ncbi:cell wall assembly/cell proliferation coordinating protein [Paenibacillus algicola]|uniref:Cell wall assembly/cell proliferation coordinating protein n=1 Tax=Paenibacillus algicola TaxID=2565926 RepID=A0A4P8XMR9_9BACL|nr:SMI1/KNR4 family protein [Paenibacillus algicola]QCT01589.1 cell wall assembly/cell proliferation coordinating protein [Paenibacillus algicola]
MQWQFAKSIATVYDLWAVESHFNIKLPVVYGRIVLEHHGARPIPNQFDTYKRMGHRIKTFLPVSKKEKGNVYDVYAWIQTRLQPGMIPFASDDGGNYICFDYKGNEQEPIIVFWNHEVEDTMEMVSSSFEGFMKSIY